MTTESKHTPTLTEQLKERGFDDVRPWGSPALKIELALQITDKSGITFYMPADSTLEQALQRYEQKLKAFRLADNK